MPRSLQISEDLKMRMVEMHEAGKGYKSISKTLAVHRSTVRQIIYKWKRFSTVATLPRSGRPVKITAKTQRAMLREVEKNPRLTAKDLQKSLELAQVSVHVSTIRKTLKKNGFHGRAPQSQNTEELKTKRSETSGDTKNKPVTGPKTR